MKIKMAFFSETRTHYQFCAHAAHYETMYLSKDTVKQAGIDPKKGITVTIESQKEGEQK